MNKFNISNKSSIIDLCWEDLLRKEWEISRGLKDKNSRNSPLSPQEWIENYYKVEGAEDYYEETENHLFIR